MSAFFANTCWFLYTLLYARNDIRNSEANVNSFMFVKIYNRLVPALIVKFESFA